MIQQITIKDTRTNLAHLVNQVSLVGTQFVITKFGKPTAMLTPIKENAINPKTSLSTSFAAWNKRKDIKDSAKWVAALRSKVSLRT